jgi:hypothetical protein
MLPHIVLKAKWSGTDSIHRKPFATHVKILVIANFGVTCFTQAHSFKNWGRMAIGENLLLDLV